MLAFIMAQMASAMTRPDILLAAILISGLGVLGWRYWSTHRRYQSLKSLPSPPGHWLLGNAPELLEAVKQKRFFHLLYEWSQQYGSMYMYWVGKPILMLNKPSLIEATIINGMREGSLIRSKNANRAWNDISGPILLGQSGSEWQWRRKAWNPEFTASGLSTHLATVDQACSLIVDKIRATPSDVVQVDALFVELTLRVIACLLLGIPVDKSGSSPEGPPLEVEKLYKATSVITYRFLRVVTGEKRWMKYLPTAASREYWSARRYLESFLAPRIDLALNLRDQPANDSGSSNPLFQNSMLVKIVAKEPRYTKETLIAEMIELLIAGTDTTAHTLSFTVAQLASHPDIFQKAQGIVDQVWQQYGTLSPTSLKDLTYLRAIVKETLRLYSIASGSTSLEAVKETIVEGITIPPGTRIFWSTLAAGRDAETYEQPDEFRPERWLEEGKECLSLPMISFGSGAHRCLGEPLAMLEATMMLAQLLRHFEWELVSGSVSLENLRQNLLIYPPDGMPIRFKLRDTVLVEI